MRGGVGSMMTLTHPIDVSDWDDADADRLNLDSCAPHTRQVSGMLT